MVASSIFESIIGAKMTDVNTMYILYTCEFFHNYELEREATKRATKALELFGRYDLTLWG